MFYGNVAACSCIASRRWSLLQILRKKLWPRANCTYLSLHSSHHAQAEEMSIFTKTIDYSGHVIRPKQRTTPNSNLSRLCNVFQRSVHSFASVAAPLSAMLQTDQPTVSALLSENNLRSANAIKNILTPPLVPALSNTIGQMTIDTDTFNV